MSRKRVQSDFSNKMKSFKSDINIRRAAQQGGVRVLFNFLRQEITITCRKKRSKN